MYRFVFQLFVSAICLARADLPAGYRVQKEIKLNGNLIQLLMDKRITQKTEFDALPDNSRNGIVRLLGANGSEIEKRQLDVPRGDVELLKGELNGKTFLFITEDKSIGFGSYNGPISNLYSLDGGNLAKVVAIHEHTGKESSIELMRSLKTNWKVKKSGVNGYPEIFEVSCRPDFSYSGKDVRFVVTYAHFLYDGRQWTRRERTARGFWEDEGAFPKENAFP